MRRRLFGGEGSTLGTQSKANGIGGDNISPIQEEQEMAREMSTEAGWALVERLSLSTVNEVPSNHGFYLQATRSLF